MNEIRRLEREALDAANVTNRGRKIKKRQNKCTVISIKNKKEKKEDTVPGFLYEVPEEYPGFKGLCLPLTIILACFIELGHLLQRFPYKNKGTAMSKLNSVSGKLDKAACVLLSEEFEKIKIKIKELKSIKNFTFSNTLHLFQRYFKVILISSIFHIKRRYF